MEKFKGIFSALVTPFDGNDEVNVSSLEKLVKKNVSQGVNGFYVGGSTGEAFLLSLKEREQIMEVTKSCSADKTLIAHVGAMAEKDAIILAKKAKELGYDAISSVTPTYFKYSFNDIKDYYKRLADVSGLPMLIYHIPALSGVSMGVKEISEFLSDDRFIGIKYTSNDFFTMERVRTEFPNKIIYNGYDEMFLSGIAMGADGAVGTTYNFMADKFVKMYDLFSRGENKEALKIQATANAIIQVLIKVGVIPATKEVLTQLGIDCGDCRRPFGKLSEESKKIITEEILPLL